MKIGIIKEGKNPPDSRVPLTPAQCKRLKAEYPEIDIVVQSTDHRCYKDDEYAQAGIQIVENVDDCSILFGVKEVPIEQLIPYKKYLFFSHTIKKQPYNQKLLQAIVKKHIQLIDYECLVDPKGIRVIAFGRWAGIVGAHNGLKTYGKRTGKFDLPPVYQIHDYMALQEIYKTKKITPLKIVVTGFGRVATGVLEVLDQLNIRKISPDEFLEMKKPDKPVYTQLYLEDMYARIEDGEFDQKEFFTKPELYKSTFAPFWKSTDLMINAIYWNPKAPVFFSKQDMRNPLFRIKVIADITCDIEGSVPSTLRASTISNPVYGYNPVTGKEEAPYSDQVIDMMAVDNLPNELPRDASEDFGNMLIQHVWDALIKNDNGIIERASITLHSGLNPRFEYLRDYLEGK
jgi:alanine dehydrogenase